jgi:hypothetical protein
LLEYLPGGNKQGCEQPAVTATASSTDTTPVTDDEEDSENDNHRDFFNGLKRL